MTKPPPFSPHAAPGQPDATAATASGGVAGASGIEAAFEGIALAREDRLQHVRDIADGGMGRVEHVVDRALHRRAAKKTVRPDLGAESGHLMMLVREAQVVSQLDHPNIVPVHDIGYDRHGNLYFTMKLVEGRTLAELLDELPDAPIEPMRLFALVEIMVRVCDALSLAHSRGIVHCDVKPDNIMVGDFGEVYLMDWGVAQPMQGRDREGDPGRGATGVRAISLDTACNATTGTSVGTIAYMSPEQARGDVAGLTHATDVFCVGAVLYEILVRRPPYGGNTLYGALVLACEGCFPPPEQVVGEERVPPGLRAIIMRAMAREPGERHGSVVELKHELLQFLQGSHAFPRARFPAGICIVRQGEPGNEAYIIDSGRCEVFTTVGDAHVVIRTLDPGGVFGEMEILSPGPRMASVRALDDVTVQVVTREILERELTAMRPWMGALVRSLADRFREVSAARPAVAPGTGEIVRQAVMCLHTWGERGTESELAMRWDALCRMLAPLTGGDAGLLRDALLEFGGIQISPERNVVTAPDPASLAARLAPGPESA